MNEAEKKYAPRVLLWPHQKSGYVRRAQGLPCNRANMGGWMGRANVNGWMACVLGWGEPMGALLYHLPLVPWEQGAEGRPALFDASSLSPGDIVLTHGYEKEWKSEYRFYLVLDINDEDMIVQEMASADAIAALRGKGEGGR